MRSLKTLMWESRLNYGTFNNTLSPRINLKYYLHWRKCRRQYERKYSQKLYNPNAPVLRDGACHLKGVLDKDVAAKFSQEVSRFVDEKINLRVELGHENYVGIEKPISNLGRELVDVLDHPELSQAIKEHFGSHYRLLWLDCYRSFPSEKRNTAWLWHSDNVPCRTLKLMLLLTDAPRDRGATRFLTPDDTNAYRAKGYYGTRVSERLSDLEEFAHSNNLPYRPYVNEGEQGDMLLFDNNNLHKAVPPEKVYRDVLTYLLVPSQVPWREALEQSGIGAVEENPGGYPASPEFEAK